MYNSSNVNAIAQRSVNAAVVNSIENAQEFMFPYK